MKRILLRTLIVVGLCFAAGLVPAADSAGKSAPRERLLLDFNWRFQLGDPADAGKTFDFPEVKDLAKTQIAEIGIASELTAGLPDPAAVNLGGDVSFVQPGFNDRAWRKLDLPHDWAVELPFNPSADLKHGFKDLDLEKGTTVGWYRRRFRLMEADRGKSLWIEFDGVFRNSLVWLNGKCLGRHVSGYTGARYDIGKLVNFDGDNVLVVRVDASRFEGWFYEGAGIYRHVWLVKTSPVHVAQWGTFVTTALDGSDAMVKVETKLRNDSAVDIDCALVTAVADHTGKLQVNLAKQASMAGTYSNLVIKAGDFLIVTQTMRITRPQLWSLESPYLYRLISTVERKAVIYDRYETPFGVRTFRYDPDQGIFLNGKHVKILGTCNHQNHAGVGTAMPDRLQAYRLERLKEMGCNAYRTAHYPPTPELLDACDRLGILVLAENRRADTDPRTLRDLESMVVRDRNHPSIFMWSLGNEEFVLQDTNAAAQEAAVAIAKTMQDIVHQLDPTRPCTLAMNNGWGEGFSEVIDVQGFNYRTRNIDPWRKRFPGKLSIATETASTRTTRGIYFDDKERGYVAAYGENGVEKPWVWWRYFAKNPFMAGGFVWTGFDYRGEPTPYKWPCISSHFGLLDTCGFPKDIYYYYQSWWTEKPVLHLAAPWNGQVPAGSNVLVRCFSNCEEVELFVNGKSVGKKSMERNGYLDWNVPYAPGVLSAKGFNQEKRIADAKIETTRPAARIRLTPDRKDIRADNEDISVVTVEVLDSKGRVVTVADNEITFTVTGGEIIGVGNGDPSSHESDKANRRKVFCGLGQVIVQSTAHAGTIELKATSPGLKPAVAKISAGPAEMRPHVR